MLEGPISNNNKEKINIAPSPGPPWDARGIKKCLFEYL